MYKTIDTLNALCVTLDGITAENYELNQSNLDCSEVHEQLADGEISLIMYLESTLGKPKGPFIKSLECSLLAAEDVINTALKDTNKEVFQDWRAVAALCRQWINRIDGYYRYNPEPGTIAHALRKRMEELPNYDKLRKSAQTTSGNNQRNTAPGNEFRSCLLIQDDKKDELLKKLHLLIDGKKGKAVALVIRLCVELGLMSKPTFGVLEAEFGKIGHHSNYDKYYRNYPAAYEEHERQGINSNLEPFKEYLDSLK